MAKRQLIKRPLSPAAVLAIFVFAGCFRPFEIADCKPAHNEKEGIFRKLEVGMTYEKVVAMMGPPGDFRKTDTYYDCHGIHMLGAVARYWSDDEQNIVLYFDSDDRLTAKELLPAL
jgi:outer membrane protein assembly factor BamE (lipoprotein component of BamABCDE complex)